MQAPRLDPVIDLGDFAARLTYDRLPSAVITTLKRILLDTMGTTLAGATLGTGCREVLGVARAAGGAPESSLIGFGDRFSAPMAALANGAMAHALNYDDVYPGGGHLGVVTVPAALAIAERQGGVSGRDLLTALAAGAEIAARLQTAIRRFEDNSSEARPQPTQMLGIFAAAATAGRLLGFGPRRMLDALGLALMQANGNRQPVLDGTPAKAIYAAFPNFGGVLSALLANAGLHAGCAVFEGEAGLFPTFYGNRFYRPALVDRIGEDYYLLDVGFKPWPTTGHAHPFIEAAIHLSHTHDLRPEDIRSVMVHGGPRIRVFCEPLATRLRPATGVEAEDSIFFGVFKGLANRQVTLADFQPDGLTQRETLRLAETTTYFVEPEMGHAGLVEVVLTTGERYEHYVEHALGDPSRPLTDDQLVGKFWDCASHAPFPLARSALNEFVEEVTNLEQCVDVAKLVALLSGPPPVSVPLSHAPTRVYFTDR